jgi:L-ascorbate metabolism protein UlaG (beta-lactamase superfamily)
MKTKWLVLTIFSIVLALGPAAVQAASQIGAGISFTWLGQAGFKIQSGSDRIVVDPWSGAQGFPAGSVNNATAVLITHGHFDHLDANLLGSVRSGGNSNPFVAIFEVATYLASQGLGTLFGNLLPMNKGGTQTVGGVKVTMVDAIHSSGIGNIFLGEQPHDKTGGEAAGYIVEFPNGFRIYHAGDTDTFGDMALIRDRYKPDMALLPIGGVFTMDPEAAALAVSLLRPKYVIPMHYAGTFGLPGTPDAFRAAVKKRLGNSVKVIVLDPGETVD